MSDHTAPYDVDDETRDALRVLRNLVACSGLEVCAAEWRCVELVTERFGLVVPHPSGIGPGTVPHNIARFEGL